jgi:LuxR family maltose regulon positive regulatory protein
MADETTNIPLIRTKLHRTQVPGNHLHRQRLLDQLNQHRNCPLILVSAPAGYGKSALISGWLESCHTPSTWLSLDENDNDPRTFLSYFLAAVQTLFPEAMRQIQGWLSAEYLPPLKTMGLTLLNDLDLIEEEFILVLDDYHLIREKIIHDLLNMLLRHPPRTFHLVVATRRDPFLPLIDLRARGQVIEVRAQALRFTAKEIALFLHQTMGMYVDDRMAAILEEKTEGWVAGLQLAALSLGDRADLDHMLENLVDDNRYVMDYFVSDILSKQPTAVQEYLLSTAILNRFCASLCAAVCTTVNETEIGSMTAKEFIRRLEQDNLFIIPLDNQRRWYRYHHLFQQLLEHQLKLKISPRDIDALHQRAGTWFAEQGLLEEALHHILATGDTKRAARLMAQHRHDLMNNEQWHRLRRWLALLPLTTIEGDPELLLVKAWLLIGWSEMADVMGRIEALLMEMPSDSAESIYLEGEFDTLRSLVCYHTAEAPAALSFAQQGLKKLGKEQNSITGLAVMLSCLSYQMLGKLEIAKKTVYQAIKAVNTEGSSYHARVMITSSFLCYMEADMKGVLQFSKQCLELGRKFKLDECIAHGHYFLGICHYDRNDPSAAESFLAPVVKGPYIVNTHNFAFSAFALALTYQALGRPIEAQEMVDLVINNAFAARNTSLLKMAQAFQAELALRKGHIAEIGHWAKTYDPEPFIVAYRFYVPQITYIKWLLTRHSKKGQQQAADLLSRLHNFFASGHNSRLLIEVLALQALFHDRKGNEQASFAALEQAVTLAEPGGLVRIFLDLGLEMADLMSRLKRENVSVRFISQILAGFSDEKPGTAQAVPDMPSNQISGADTPSAEKLLTNRELDILDLLSQRLSNKEIAEKLFISPSTVKRHTINIYEKLNVHTRREAADKALTLGLAQK